MTKQFLLAIAMAAVIGCGKQCPCIIMPLMAEEPTTIVLQDFEGPYKPSKFGKGSGEVVVSTDWKADGQKSLKLDPGLSTAFEDLRSKDWSGYSLLRFHLKNTGDQAIRVGFIVVDDKGPGAVGYWDWHISAFGVAPGEQVVDVDFSAGLWRSETNSPYRGTFKTPIEVDKINRFSLENNGRAALYIDKIELVKVKKLAVAGGFAFDFGTSGTPVMSQFTAVRENTAYAADKGFGFLDGVVFKLGTAPSFPTIMLGGGLAFPTGGFRVDLPGGKYRAWIAYERGGFWGGEQSGYSQAILKLNGQSIHEHKFSPSGAHFFFQDTEVTDLAKLNEQQIWPAHAIVNFTFDAAKGPNVFTLDTVDRRGTPLRVAGLILAPDTDEGKTFIAAHEDLQRKAIATIFAPLDRGRRDSARVQPTKPIVVQHVLPGEMIFPRDWPLKSDVVMPPELLAVAGQTVTLQFAIYTSKPQTLTVTAGSLVGENSTIENGAVSYGRYLPMRSTHNGSVWLDVSHYRPESEFSAGPDLTRSLVVEYSVPNDVKPGQYSGTIQIAGADAVTVSVPVKLKVSKVALAELPIPVGLVGNSLVFGPEFMDQKTWWELQESVIKEQMKSGLNLMSGGPGLSYKVELSGKVSGENAVRYIRIAQKYGTVKAIVPYGGFLSYIDPKVDFKALAVGLKEFEEANQMPPCYMYCYDEPNTDAEMTKYVDRVTKATEAGLKTLGYTSTHIGNPIWEKLITNTYAPAFCIHSVKDIQWVKAAGRHFIAYNNGLDRYGVGLNLWRSIKLGVEMRVNYVGMHAEGMAFYNLDGREPHYGCLMVHEKLGVLKTPQWLATREGLLDARLQLTLETMAPKDDPALKLWSIENYRTDAAKWPPHELERTRQAILKRINELSK
jgi:hypothetical protein